MHSYGTEHGGRCGLLGLIGGTCLLLGCAGIAAADAAATEEAPVALEIETVTGGAFDLATLRGQWVVVNYWATWCKPCRKEIPDLDGLHREREDISVVGLAYEETTAPEILAFLEDYPATYPIALVDVYEPPEAFGVPRVLPTTILVDPGGKVSRTIVGPVTSDDIIAHVDGVTASSP